MARETKAERHVRVHADAIKTFDEIQTAQRDVRLQCLKDRRFYSIPGAMWEGPIGEQFENKPKIEINKIHLAVIRIINEYRNNRITVDYISKEGVEDDDLADVCDGLYRATEQDSDAEEAYDNAFEEAVAGGFGAWRLRTEYEDEEDPDDDKQKIIIEPIFDADSSVFFDLQAKKQSKADATKCFVLTSMTRDVYEAEWGHSASSLEKVIHQHEFDWLTPDVVFIAEYYVVEEKRETIYIWEKLNGEEVRLTKEELEDQEEELEATGAQEVRTKTLKKKKVHKYIIDGARILEDCGYIAGNCIPIIPVYGKRWYVDNVERCMGHVRLSKDPSMVKNMQISKLAEIAALSTVSKPILSPEQVAGHRSMWEEDNIKNFPFLLINPIKDLNGQEMLSPPVAYTKPPEIPPAMGALLQVTEDDLQDILGNQQNGESVDGNASTDTMMFVQNRLDMQTYIYMSNMAKAIKRCGHVWLSIARDVYVEEGRIMKSIGSQGELNKVELLRPVTNKDGSVGRQNDMSNAKFDLTVEVGPSSSTKRAATVRALTNMAASTDDPETKQVLGAMAMMNMEGEGISDVRRYFRDKLIKMGVVEPTEQEAQELAEEQKNTPPSPQDQYFEASASAERARGEKAQADTLKSQAQTDQIRVDTAATTQEIDAKQQAQALEIIDRLGPRVTPTGIPGPGGQE